MNLTKGPTAGKWLKNAWFLSIMEYFEVVENSEVEIYVLSYNHLSGIWLNNVHHRTIHVYIN